jgi:diguanylate cyclase (GGDEF)-like protein
VEEPIEFIVVEPQEADLLLVESLAGNAAFRVTSVVSTVNNSAVVLLEGKGAQRVEDLGSVSRLLPGVVVGYLADGLPSAEIFESAARYGLSVLNRDALEKLAPQPIAERRGPSTRDFLGRYRRLLEDYFPTSWNSSTAVKLTACLTEVTTVWAATGGAVLMSVTGGTLGVAAQRGLDLPRDVVIKLDPASALFRCASRGKHEVISDFPGEVLPGISAKSAICIAIKSGEATRGVLILWSSEPDAFTQDDVGALSLFAYYLATLIEFDELGDRLGENLVTDPLTGLHNRRQFETRLDQELLRAKRYTLNLSLIVFDVDQLANYNNACGQMLGNLALSDIASILTKGTREVDFVSRIGGDEFAVILPETNRLGALRLADRLRSEVSSYPFPVPEDGSTISLTVSGGISNFPAATSPENDLLATAYVALEQAKQERTDSVKLWDAKTQ